MPKRNKDFPARLDISVPPEMRLQLIAIGYYRGIGGEYATPARNMIDEGIAKFFHGLSAVERSRFDEILANVKIREGVLP